MDRHRYEHLRRKYQLVRDLEDARLDYLWGRDGLAYLGLLRIIEEIQNDPELDSKEHQYGKRQSFPQDYEQEQEEETTERDEDGYLIR